MECRRAERKGERTTLMSSTARKVGANENPDHRLDELQLRDRCIGQLGGPPEEQTDSVKRKRENMLEAK